MAARIRLKKVGRKGQPSYRVVVLDGRKPRDAKVVADLGFYDPKTDPVSFEIDNETALKWLQDGAKATSAARVVLSKAGVLQAWEENKHGRTAETPAEKPDRPKKTEKKAKETPEERAEPTTEDAPVEAPEASEKKVEENVEEASEPEEDPEEG
jgi:small subunit ribosomal protein S16